MRKIMKIYLSSQDNKVDFLELVEHSLAEKDLRQLFDIKILKFEPRGNHRGVEELLANSEMVTLLVTAVGAGGIGTVIISNIARVIETLINSHQVQIKIEREGQQIEMLGSAESIAEMLKDVLK